jgi:hypothetical protein
MHTAQLIPLLSADPGDIPHFIPESSSFINANKQDVEYLCGECSTTIATLPYEVDISDVLGDHFDQLDKDILAIGCPDCDMLNEIPNRAEKPHQRNVDANLANFLAESEQTGLQNVSGPEGHSVDPEIHLLNHWEDIYELSRDDLLSFARYLSDAAVRTSPPRISYDHSVYWAWTAAYVTEHPLSESEPFESLVREYLSLVHFMIFKLRHIYSRVFYAPGGLHTNVGGRDITWQEAFEVTDWGNPSTRHVALVADRYAASTGFAVLEGLINIHCNDLSTKEGVLTSEVNSPWHPHQSTIKGEHTYHDKLQLWRYSTSNEKTRDSLSLIDDLTRYNFDTLRSNMAGVEEVLKEERNTTNHFLRVIARQRNLNLHGQLPTRIAGTLITTLCSLLIWDAVPTSDFKQHRETVIWYIQNRPDEAFDKVMSAPAFMPVDRVQHLSDVNTLLPSDSDYPELFDRFRYGKQD